jgi:hypothetical protein
MGLVWGWCGVDDLMWGCGVGVGREGRQRALW